MSLDSPSVQLRALLAEYGTRSCSTSDWSKAGTFLAQHHKTLAQCLEDDDPDVRKSALQAFERVTEAVSLQHKAIAKRLEDDEPGA